MRSFFLIVALLFLTQGLGAQEGEDIDWDSLFETDEPTIVDVPDPEVDLVGDLLVSEGILWGGKIDSSLAASWVWESLESWEDFGQGEQGDYISSLDAQLFFDSRPNKDFRAYGKLQFLYPFQQTALIEGDLLSLSGMKVLELFSEFSLGEVVSLRVGKFQSGWGAGYFFSPADVINLGPVDPQDPEADREGPLNARARYSWGAHALELNLISEGADQPQDVALAPKGTFVFGTTQLELGGLVQYGGPQKIMATASGPLGELDFFTELLVQYESERTFWDPDNPAQTLDYSGTWFITPSAGLALRKSSWDFFGALQYIYDSQLQYVQLDQGTGMPLLASEVGAHLVAGLLQWQELWGSDFGLRLFALSGVIEPSGMVQGFLTWKPWDYFELETGLTYNYGNDYTPFGQASALEAQLILKLGSGKF